MKAFLLSLALLLTATPSFASDIPVKNTEFAQRAKAAAKALFDQNWGPSQERDFEISEEDYFSDDTSEEGVYRVVSWTTEDDERRPRGIDFVVTVILGAVMKVQVDCKACG